MLTFLSRLAERAVEAALGGRSQTWSKHARQRRWATPELEHSLADSIATSLERGQVAAEVGRESFRSH